MTRPQLTSDDYGRMVCATVACRDCRAHRGEPCRNPSSGRPWAISCFHTNRRSDFYTWRRHHRAKYKAMRDRLLWLGASAAGFEVTYVTMPA